jgi:hypothetical protein
MQLVWQGNMVRQHFHAALLHPREHADTCHTQYVLIPGERILDRLLVLAVTAS